MKLEHSFTVPAPVDRAWATLLDIEGVAPCFPGATLTGVDGDEFTGVVKVKVGPVSLTYTGRGRFLERDDVTHRAVIDASGRDKNGNGTAGATVHARMEPDGAETTRVVVETDLKVTGRPAQFGRGVVQDVGGRIVDQFAGCLAARMAAGPDAAAGPGAAGAGAIGLGADAGPDHAPPRVAEATAPSGPARPAARRPSPVRPLPTSSGTRRVDDAPAELDLGAAVLPTLARRFAPVLGGLLAFVVMWRLVRRWRRR